MALTAARSVAKSLFKLSFCGIVTADYHKIAPQNFVSVGVFDIEAERLGEGFDRVANLFLSELAVAEGVPTPGRSWMFFYVRGEQWFDFFISTLAKIGFKLENGCGSVLGGFAVVRPLVGIHRTRHNSRFQLADTLP